MTLDQMLLYLPVEERLKTFEDLPQQGSSQTLPNQAHRLGALGNAVDTGIPELLGRAWIEAP